MRQLLPTTLSLSSSQGRDITPWPDAPDLLGSAGGRQELAARCAAATVALTENASPALGVAEMLELAPVQATAEATVALMRAAIQIATPESRQSAFVLGRLQSAVRLYEFAWGMPGRIRGRFPAFADWPADTAGRLAAVVAMLRGVEGCPAGVTMVRSGLAACFPDEPVAAELLPEALWTVRLPLLAVSGCGQVVTLRLELFPGNRGEKCLVPDARSVGSTVFDADFRQSLRTAWEFARPHLPATTSVRWSLMPPGVQAGRIEGGSAGAAFAAGLIGLGRGVCFERVGLSAAVNANGKLLPIAAECEKAAGAYRAGLRRVVFAARGERAERELRECVTDGRPDFEVIFAASVEAALGHLITWRASV